MEKPGFNINGYQTYRTIFGTIISIFVFIASIIFFFIFNNELYLYKKPNIIHSYHTQYNNKLKFKKENIILFSLQDKYNNHYIDQSIYIMNIYNIKIYNSEKNINITKKSLNLVNCSYYKFSILQNYFNKLPLDNLYCINLTDIELQGHYLKNKWEYIYVEFSKCENSTKNNYLKLINIKIN